MKKIPKNNNHKFFICCFKKELLKFIEEGKIDKSIEKFILERLNDIEIACTHQLNNACRSIDECIDVIEEMKVKLWETQNGFGI